MYSVPPHAIMFHHFHGESHPAGQGAISSSEFEQIIAFIGRKNILSATEWLRQYERDALRPEQVCFTFDDALKCQMDIALPVLESYGIKAMFFVYSSILRGATERLELYRYFRTALFNTIDDFYVAFDRDCENSIYAGEIKAGLADFQSAEYLKEFAFYTDNDRKFRFLRDRILGPDKYFEIMDRMVENVSLDLHEIGPLLWMDRDDIVTLDRLGHVIGLHSDTHPTAIAELSIAQQKMEYMRNFKALMKMVGNPITTMSHPCGSYSADTLKLLSDMGIKAGFRSNMTELASRTSLEIAREDHSNLMTRMC